MDSGTSAAARPRTWPRHWNPAPSRERWSSAKARSRPWSGSASTPASEAGSRLASVTGGLPARCGEVAGTERVSVLWLGPSEFLVVAPEEAHDTLGGDLLGS